jgi:hypothetical protein
MSKRPPTPDMCTQTHDTGDGLQIYKVVFTTQAFGQTFPVTYETFASSPKEAIKKTTAMHAQWIANGYKWKIV